MNERFNRWAEEKGIDLSKAKRRAYPEYWGYHGFKHGNIFLTGDAFACTVDGEGIYQAIRSGEIAAKTIIDPKWNYKPELRDLLRYHKYLGWLLPWMLVFPDFSRKLIENLEGMLRSNSLNSAYRSNRLRSYTTAAVYKPCLQGCIMHAISTVVPLVGSLKFVRSRIIGK